MSWATVGLLVGVPVLALGAASLVAEPDPFGQPTPGFFELFSDPRTLRLWMRSFGLALLVALFVLPVGGVLAWAEHRLELAGRRVLFALTLLPLAIPSYILAAAVARTFGPTATLPLVDTLGGLVSSAFVIGLVTVPYVQLVVGSALVHGSAAEEEAARTLGASPFRVFLLVVLPRIRPALGYSALLAMLYALSDFGAVAVLDAPVLTWRLYQAVAGQQLARAGVLGIALLGATLPLFLATRALQGRESDRTVANPRPVARRKGGLVEVLAAYGAIGLVVGLGVVLPVLSLAQWTLEGVQRGLPFAPLVEPVLHTLFAAAFGAVVTVALAMLPAAVVGMRRRSGLLDGATYLTSALPGVLLAFGWILASLALARGIGSRTLYPALLGSGSLLFLGYATRYLAEAYTPIKTLAWRFDRRLWEAHRTLGVDNRQFLRVAWPAMRPGLGVALLVAFLAILKELPVTLLLGGATGLTTLAFRVWDRHSEALWHDAGAAGLCLVGVALAGVWATLGWRGRGY